jgi:hypothetical protein
MRGRLRGSGSPSSSSETTRIVTKLVDADRLRFTAQPDGSNTLRVDLFHSLDGEALHVVHIARLQFLLPVIA